MDRYKNAENSPLVGDRLGVCESRNEVIVKIPTFRGGRGGKGVG